MLGEGLRTRGLRTLEVLHRTLMLLRRLPRAESSKVAAFASLCILLARVQAIPTGFQFSYHRNSRAPQNQPFVRRWLFLVRLALTAAL